MEYLLCFVLYKRSPSFYKGFQQTLTHLRAVSRSHHVELVAAAMAKLVKKKVPGCAWISTVTRRSDKGARRSNSGSASSKSRSISSSSSSGSSSGSSSSSSSGSSSDSSDSSHSKSQQVTALTAVTAVATATSTSTSSISISSSCSCSSSSSNRGDAGAVGALLVLVRQMPAAKAQLGPAVAMVVVAVVAGWGRRFASSWPGPCQAASHEFCLRFCLRFGFVPERKTRRENETAG